MGTRTIIPGSNNAGQIGSDSKYWNKGYFNELYTNTLYTSATGLTTNTIRITSGSITFEGSSVDDHELRVVVTDPTTDRTVEFQDASGTIALTSDIPAAYTLPLATTSVRGGVELGSDTDLTETYETGGTGTSSRTYPVQLNSDNQMGVSVPWTDTNTTYSAGTGIDLSTTTFNLDLTEVITADGNNRVLTSDGDGTLTAESGFTATTSTIEFAGTMLRIGDTEGSGATFEHHGASGASYNGGSLTIEAGSPQVGVGVNKNAGALILKSGMSTGTGNAGVVEIWANKEYGSTSGTAYTQERVADFTNPGGTATFRITDDDDDFCKIAVGSSTTISTSSSGGSGNLTLDVQGNMVLDCDGGNIDFKDDGVFLARISSTGLSFNTNAGAGIQFEGATSNSYETSLNVVDPTADRTINLPDASGTIQLQGGAGEILHVNISQGSSTMVYMNTQNYWYSMSGYSMTTGYTGAIASHSNFNYTSQGSHPGYTAIRACKVTTIIATWRMSSSYFGSSDDMALEFGVLKWTNGDDSTSSVAVTDMTVTDHDGNYRENKIYNKIFVITDNADAALAVGDSFNLFARCTNQGSGGTTVRIFWYGEVTAEVVLT